MSKKLNIFIHIPKTAGSSFAEVIKSNEQNIVRQQGLKSFILLKLPETGTILGHNRYGLGILKGLRAQYFTFLRNPTERCISWYYFVQEWHKHPCYHDAVNNDIVGFYSLSKYKNLQTKYIGGHVLLPTELLPSSYLLNSAKKRLGKNVIYGITEKYQQSVERICTYLDWTERPIVHTRHAKLRPKTNEIDSNTLAEIARLNNLDWELYQYALDKFENS